MQIAAEELAAPAIRSHALAQLAALSAKGRSDAPASVACPVAVEAAADTAAEAAAAVLAAGGEDVTDVWLLDQPDTDMSAQAAAHAATSSSKTATQTMPVAVAAAVPVTADDGNASTLSTAVAVAIPKSPKSAGRAVEGDGTFTMAGASLSMWLPDGQAGAGFPDLNEA